MRLCFWFTEVKTGNDGFRDACLTYCYLVRVDKSCLFNEKTYENKIKKKKQKQKEWIVRL
jgi:hypothetical protein